MDLHGISKFFIALILSCLVVTAQAAVLRDLYHAEVIIPDQTQRSQDRAARDAFEQVLIKVSGNRRLISDKDIQSHIRNAKDFLRSFRFDITANQIVYKAEFDSQKIETLLRVSGFPIWGERRPDTLIWLAKQDSETGDRQLVTPLRHEALIDEAQATAKTRGINILFPIMDLTDIDNVSVYDVWGGYTQNIVEASERYATEYVASARLFYTSVETSTTTQSDPSGSASAGESVWLAEWTLVRPGEFFAGKVTADTQEQATGQLVEALADKLAELHAIDISSISGEDRIAVIKVDNIDSLVSYMEVNTFLADLSVVISSTLTEQTGNTATFYLELLGEQSNLLNALRLDDRMQAVESQAGVSQTLHFVWKP